MQNQAKHVIQGESAQHHLEILERQHNQQAQCHYVRNYLLDYTHVDEIGVRWLDETLGVDVDHLEWTLGFGIAAKESLLIQHKVNVQSKECSVIVRSKLRPLGSAIQQRQLPISQQALSALLSKFRHQYQEKIIYTVATDHAGQALIEWQPTSVITLEFTGSHALEHQLRFMQSEPGLLQFRKPFKTQFVEFQSKMGVQYNEQRSLNSLSFAQASVYNNLQSSPVFIERLHRMATAALDIIATL